jgi:hypothetical protein
MKEEARRVDARRAQEMWITIADVRHNPYHSRPIKSKSSRSKRFCSAQQALATR